MRASRLLRRCVAGGGGPVWHEAPESVRVPQIRIPDQPDDSRALHVAMVGAPNAGKSALTNRLTGQRVSAVSNKYNTTRQRTMGAYTHSDGRTQLMFWDTPGFVAESDRSRLFQPLVVTASRTVTSADVCLFVVDAVRRRRGEYLAGLRRMMAEAAAAQAEPVAVLNKIDLLKRKEYLLDTAQEVCELIEDAYQKPYPGVAFMLSAKTGDGVDDLRRFLLARAEPGEWAVPSDVFTDQSELSGVIEVVREALFKYLHAEVPYRVLQENRVWEDRPGRPLRVVQDVLVARKAQAAIVRAALGRVEKYAREELSASLGRPVAIELRVRVEEKLRFYDW